jgi:hypothetical protein
MSKSGYSLIIIGLILLAYNYSFIDFSLLSGPLVLPIILIIAGSLKIFKSLFNQNDLLDVISSLVGIILFLSIIINIFNLPLIFIPTNVESVIELNPSNLTASFTSIDFLIDYNQLNINYESNNKNYIESIEYLTNYSIFNSFSDSTYNFNNFLANNLLFENSFGESTISNLAYVDNSVFENSFGELIIYTGEIIGEKEIIINNKFGSTKLIIDESAAYSINTVNVLGVVNNNIGLETKDYINTTDKIKIFISNKFGSVQLLKQ